MEGIEVLSAAIVMGLSAIGAGIGVGILGSKFMFFSKLLQNYKI